ncbi:MAG: alkaline phosphatase family protein [Planctomycetaceae bacterium]
MSVFAPWHRADWTRREFLGAAGALALAAGCGKKFAPVREGGVERVIVLGVDGMDPNLLRQFLDAGRMPNCKRLIEMGSYSPLATANPPQSPVAWSNFISGANPGVHGIFDFIARDPQTMLPYLSTSRLITGSKPIKLGKYLIPTSAGRVENLRHGATLWEELEHHGIPCSIFRMPANFPPSKTEAVTLSGMGTPDLTGTYGTFSWFTDNPDTASRELEGGRIVKITGDNDVFECRLRGLTNEFLADQPAVEVPLIVYRDPEQPVVRIVVQDQTLILKEKEWSDWVVVKFPLVPYAVEASGICRLYLKSVHEPFGLYVSPINIDPADPSLPISTPPDYSKRLVRELGYYYTQGMVEDHHALKAKVLDEGEYRQQATFVHDERLRFFEHELARFETGLLFYYFSTLDLSCHVFWRTIDPQHPLYSKELAEAQGDFIGELYEKVDRAIGQALERLDGKTWLMVMSDHGFSSFRRQFNLNSWLIDNGYLRLQPGTNRATAASFQGVNWSRTKAYGLGLNGLYLNRIGRERDGYIDDRDADLLMDLLIQQLEAVRDPDTGEQVITHVRRAQEIYSGPHAGSGPDLLIGYNKNYRASWDTVLGGFPDKLILDNTEAWSGDHCIDPEFVPGVLLSSRPLSAESPRLEDLAPTILTAFGAAVPDTMTGKNVE